MTRAYVPLLLALTLLWGGSYLCIKVAVEEIEPTALVLFRLAIAGAILLPFLLVRVGARRGAAQLRAAARPGLVLGVLNVALPFFLIAWAETHVDSGVAAIANSTVPIFVVLLAIRFKPSERASGGRLAGILLGVVGVAVLTGGQPDGGWWAVAGTLAVVAASLAYAVTGIYAQLRVAETPALVLATASTLAGALVLLPFGLAQLPHALPGWKALASLAALAVLGTAFAQLLMFRMLRLHGAARLSLVTYLLPAAALFYGAALLDEPLSAGMLGGLALILLGVALGSGGARLQRRVPATATPRG
jgi:drug/metabolite transporter (DMT)-like permease